jgi:transposase-like protein
VEWNYWNVMLLSKQEDSMGRRGYPGEFRRRALDLVAAGRGVADIARDLGISDQTVYSWRRQERIDQGVEPGLTSGERAELVAARRRIRELEAELAIHRKAAELLKGTTSPKGGSRPSK